MGKFARTDYPSAWCVSSALVEYYITHVFPKANTARRPQQCHYDSNTVFHLKRGERRPERVASKTITGNSQCNFEGAGCVENALWYKNHGGSECRHLYHHSKLIAIQVAEDFHSVFQEQYMALSSNIPALSTPSSYATKAAADMLQLGHLMYKCVSRVAVWLWHRLAINKTGPKFSENLIRWVRDIIVLVCSLDQSLSQMTTFFDYSANQFQSLTDLRISLFITLSEPPHGVSPDRPPLDTNGLRTLDFLMRHIRHLGKFFRRVQQLSAVHFVKMSSSVSLVSFGWSKVIQATEGASTIIKGTILPRTFLRSCLLGTDSYLAAFPVRFLVQCMVLFRDSLAQWTPSKQGSASGETANLCCSVPRTYRSSQHSLRVM